MKNCIIMHSVFLNKEKRYILANGGEVKEIGFYYFEEIKKPGMKLSNKYSQCVYCEYHIINNEEKNKDIIRKTEGNFIITLPYLSSYLLKDFDENGNKSLQFTKSKIYKKSNDINKHIHMIKISDLEDLKKSLDWNLIKS